MISDNEPVLTKYISVPKELSQLNCNAFVAGIVEAVLDGCQFVGMIRQTKFHQALTKSIFPIACTRYGPYCANRWISSKNNDLDQIR